ncbi:hypothetical protein L210DRAFT_2086620 [Boletus edulis BED1]|uniref:Uncharacterized protein n=1 Tax=Boletus edulis BED1 TaxID=1328754 RepID=A0AAD4BWR2_BOLED|nr:hypothetical protein L210DRAFT_2086620 [Boletus edulis BED1]
MALIDATMVLLVLFAHNLTLAPIYTKAISILPTLVGFVAKSVPHISKGERHKGYRICDIAFEHFHSSHLRFLLLTKAIIVFMAGERPGAISRLDDLTATVPSNPLCFTVQTRARHTTATRRIS